MGKLASGPRNERSKNGMDLFSNCQPSGSRPKTSSHRKNRRRTRFRASTTSLPLPHRDVWLKTGFVRRVLSAQDGAGAQTATHKPSCIPNGSTTWFCVARSGWPMSFLSLPSRSPDTRFVSQRSLPSACSLAIARSRVRSAAPGSLRQLGQAQYRLRPELRRGSVAMKLVVRVLSH